MHTLRLSALMIGLVVLTGGLTGQEPKKDPPAGKKEEGKLKGQLPQGFGKLGLSDEQKQKVYKINAKFGDEIDRLEAQIKDLKAKMAKERFEVLTVEQKKKYDEDRRAKTGG